MESIKNTMYSSFTDSNRISPAYYDKYSVKRGLRNSDGTGVMAGVTNICNVHGYVVDYLRLSFFPPICNFADYCITAGTVCLLVYLIFFSDFLKDDKKKKKEMEKIAAEAGEDA